MFNVHVFGLWSDSAVKGRWTAGTERDRENVKALDCKAMQSPHCGACGQGCVFFFLLILAAPFSRVNTADYNLARVYSWFLPRETWPKDQYQRPDSSWF